MMKEKLSTEMRIGFSSAESAMQALAAIKPELNGKHEKRAKTTMKAQKNFLVFSIIAEDFSAMKASMDSVSKTIALAKEFTGGCGFNGK